MLRFVLNQEKTVKYIKKRKKKLKNIVKTDMHSLITYISLTKIDRKMARIFFDNNHFIHLYKNFEQ